MQGKLLNVIDAMPQNKNGVCLCGGLLGRRERGEKRSHEASMVRRREVRGALTANRWVIKTTTDETLGIEDCVGGVHCALVLCRSTHQSLVVAERNIRRSGPCALDDVNAMGMYARVVGVNVSMCIG